jgi:hypothetical protein
MQPTLKVQKYLNRTDRKAVPSVLRKHVCGNTASANELALCNEITFSARSSYSNTHYLSYRIAIEFIEISNVK